MTSVIDSRGDAELVASPYSCALLVPSRLLNAAQRNTAWLGPMTLGIEVTEPELASLCGLGNLDPQHTGGDASGSAVEAALDLPLPPVGARLVTIRPDADAFGAMAVLKMRAAGHNLGAAARRRVVAIGRADRAVSGPWPGPQPIPVKLGDLQKMLDSGDGVSALAAACVDHRLTIGERVGIAATWIRTGAAPAQYAKMASARAADIGRSWTDGGIALDVILDGRVALLRTLTEAALRLGYRIAPVILAIEEDPRRASAVVPRRVTICQWGEGWVDLRALATDLSHLEAGWGGSPTIIGSPQGVGASLSTHVLIERLEAALLNRT